MLYCGYWHRCAAVLIIMINICLLPFFQINHKPMLNNVFAEHPVEEQPLEEEQPQLDQHPPSEELLRLKTMLAQRDAEIDLLRKNWIPNRLTPEILHHSSITNYFQYCTGFNYDKFNNICSVFAVPSTETSAQTSVPLIYKRVDQEITKMPLRHQLLLVLMKLRQNFDLKDLAFRFQIPERSVGTLFNSWIDYMFGVLGELPAWPHRNTIISQMPDKYRNNFPTTLAILDCTEIKIQKPSSLVLQSQSFSNYKSTNTLKSLIACDPRGAILFTSTLFTGALSDKDIFQKSNFLQLMKSLIEHNYLNKGDGVMVDKGFLIENDLDEIGLRVNIPPFAQSNKQMSATDVTKTKKIAAHRVHVERAIGKVKKFKIVSGRIPNVRLGNINQIWYVVSMLSNFQPNIL